MMLRLCLRILAILLLACMVLGVTGAFTATNNVARSNVGKVSKSISANNLKPSACSGQNVTNIIKGSGMISGTLGNDLILGSSGDDIIDGQGGDDCILGGGGNDTLIGGDGNDTCIGGPGTDSFDDTCEKQVQ
jgi:Ca2+-binding RTX toxin-like protein